ncbi:MAG: hypothetical protein MRJ92_03295 [Nitrospira sp.]|nr:hypothetical protein [Nitrospira sp.]
MTRTRSPAANIFCSSILDSAWRAGQDLDLAALIHQIQTPPMVKVGVLDLGPSSVEPVRVGHAAEQFAGGAGFCGWMEGEPLDVGQMLYGASGKPRIAIF